MKNTGPEPGQLGVSIFVDIYISSNVETKTLSTRTLTWVLPLLVKPNLPSTFCKWHRFPNPILSRWESSLSWKCACVPASVNAPTVQPPTSSPCVSSGCRHPERGFKLLSSTQASTWRTIHGLGPVSEPVKWGREREDISGRETHWRIN